MVRTQHGARRVVGLQRQLVQQVALDVGALGVGGAGQQRGFVDVGQRVRFGLRTAGVRLRCTRTHLNGFPMATTKIFKNGNSQAVRIPAELAYSTWDVDLIIERQGDELRIRPAQRRMGDVMAKLAKFSPDFMVDGRPGNEEGERAVL